MRAANTCKIGPNSSVFPYFPHYVGGMVHHGCEPLAPVEQPFHLLSDAAVEHHLATSVHGLSSEMLAQVRRVVDGHGPTLDAAVRSLRSLDDGGRASLLVSLLRAPEVSSLFGPTWRPAGFESFRQRVQAQSERDRRLVQLLALAPLGSQELADVLEVSVAEVASSLAALVEEGILVAGSDRRVRLIHGFAEGLRRDDPLPEDARTRLARSVVERGTKAAESLWGGAHAEGRAQLRGWRPPLMVSLSEGETDPERWGELIWLLTEVIASSDERAPFVEALVDAAPHDERWEQVSEHRRSTILSSRLNASRYRFTPQVAVEMGSAALRLAGAQKEARARAILALSQALRISGQLEEADGLIREMLHEEGLSARTSGELWMAAANIARSHGYLDEVRHAVGQALRIGRRNQLDPMLTHALGLLGTLDRDAGNRAQAIISFREAESLSSKHGIANGWLPQLISLLQEEGKSDAAERLAQELLEVSQKTEIPSLGALVWAELATARLLRNDLLGAREALVNALRAQEVRPIEAHVSMLHAQKALVESLLELDLEARVSAERALETALPELEDAYRHVCLLGWELRMSREASNELDRVRAKSAIETSLTLLQKRDEVGKHWIHKCAEVRTVYSLLREPLARSGFVVDDSLGPVAVLHVDASTREFAWGAEKKRRIASAAGWRIFCHLLGAHRTDKAFSAEELFVAGWGDEAVKGNSGRDRVYVAILQLRKGGLDKAIERTESGYRIDPNLVIDK